MHRDIEDAQVQSTNIEDIIEDRDKKLQVVNGEIKVLETQRKTIMQNIRKVEELEDKYAAYQ